MSTRIVLLIDNVHMGLSHDGLSLLAKKFKIDTAKLEEGELLMFLNRKRDKLKIVGCQGKVVGYLKMPRGERIMLDAIQYIPRTFGGHGFSYEKALTQALTEKLKRANKPKSPLETFRAMKASGLTNARMQ